MSSLVEEAYKQGFDDGYDKGYQQGYADSEEDNSKVKQNEKIAKLKKACELGLEFAQEDLTRAKFDFAGYPDRWELTETYIKQIKEALEYD